MEEGECLEARQQLFSAKGQVRAEESREDDLDNTVLKRLVKLTLSCRMHAGVAVSCKVPDMS